MNLKPMVERLLSTVSIFAERNYESLPHDLLATCSVRPFDNVLPAFWANGKKRVTAIAWGVVPQRFHRLIPSSGGKRSTPCEKVPWQPVLPGGIPSRQSTQVGI